MHCEFKFGNISNMNSNIYLLLSTVMEVSVSLSCLFVYEPPYQTVVACCNPFLPQFFMHEPPYQVPASVGLAQACPNESYIMELLGTKWPVHQTWINF